jgi:maltooligosyltrehalose trehalohydrolase
MKDARSGSERSHEPRARSRGASRRYRAGPELRNGGVDFRVWAPKHARVELMLAKDGLMLAKDGLSPARNERSLVGGAAPADLDARELEAEGDGWFSLFVPELGAGARYGFRLDGEQRVLPDPASHAQPDGPHGLSEVIDHRAFAWSDGAWSGIGARGLVVYELHLGTFTEAGTWEAARARLPHLEELGVRVVEVMPIAEFSGEYGWGYDGVDLYAPHHHYGRPDDVRSFVDAAHALGLGVILDVVYNHFGPDGNYLPAFSDHYLSRTATEWGDAIDYDGEHSRPVRDFVCDNAAYWIREFHFDGLRLDATQSIFDRSPTHVIDELGARARDAAGGRGVWIVAENEKQEARLARPREQHGYGLDALWNDDLHHTLIVALSGRAPAYYSDHEGSPQEIVSAAKHGFLFQGQRYAWQEQRRGQPARGLPPRAFVAFLENHDQVANGACGDRLATLVGPARLRAATALLLLGAWTPMLFQGQEWGSTRPFLYFADHEGELAAQVRRGRREFLSQFPGCAAPEVSEKLADPALRATFEKSRLDWNDRDSRARAMLALHQDLLRLRREDPVLSRQGEDGVEIDGAVLDRESFALRFFSAEGDDRLLLVVLGRDLERASIAEPLLAPPEGRRWELAWSSEHPRYGGSGTPEIEHDGGWLVVGHSTVLLAAVPREESDAPDRLAQV